MASHDAKPRTLSRLAWFVGIYLVSLMMFAVVVYGLRALVSG